MFNLRRALTPLPDEARRQSDALAPAGQMGDVPRGFVPAGLGAQLGAEDGGLGLEVELAGGGGCGGRGSTHSERSASGTMRSA